MVYVTVCCDVCGMEESDVPPATYAMRRARELGWRVNMRTQDAVCPSCVWDATHSEEDN